MTRVQTKQMLLRAVFSLLVAFVCLQPGYATTYVMPTGDVIGRVTYANVAKGDTLFDIARRYDLGYEEILAANPHVDPWLPEVGAKLLIPGRYVLPKAKREGVVINIAEKRLYFFDKPASGPALVSTYPVSLGPTVLSAGEGVYRVDQRLRKPTWYVSAEDKRRMKGEHSKVWTVMSPGRDNILGEYAVGLAGTQIMLHGTNKPYSVGMEVEYGYVRMYPEDIENLVNRIAKTTPVRFVNQTFKYGYKNGALYFELHKPKSAQGKLNHAALVNWMTKIVNRRMWAEDWRRVREMAEQSFGLAMPIFQEKPQSTKPKRAWMLKLASYQKIQSASSVMQKIGLLGVPLMVDGCYDGKPCVLMAGPFTDRAYMEDLRKRIKWMTRLKGYAVPYVEDDDFLPLEVSAIVADTKSPND